MNETAPIWIQLVSVITGIIVIAGVVGLLLLPIRIVNILELRRQEKALREKVKAASEPPPLQREGDDVLAAIQEQER